MNRTLQLTVLVTAITTAFSLVGCAGGPQTQYGALGGTKPNFVSYDSWGVTNTLSGPLGTLTNSVSNGNMMRQMKIPNGWIVAGPGLFVPPSPTAFAPVYAPQPSPQQQNCMWCPNGFMVPPWMRGR